MSRDVIQKILDSPIPYDGEGEEDKAKALVATLTDEQRELAAIGSYAYWLATISEQPPTEEERTKFALREARRFVHGNPPEQAEKLCKEACHYRKDRRVDLIRACFTDGIEFDNDDDQEQADKIRKEVKSDLFKQKVYVRGIDKQGRALMIMHSREHEGTIDEEFIVAQIYMMERAIACTEFISAGAEEKITVVFELYTFKSSLAPSWGAIKQMASILQNCYSERLKGLIIIDPPLWARTMYGLLKPFLDPVTRAKFLVATGDKKKLQIVGEAISEDQAMPFLLPSGKLTDEVDMDRFLEVVPFHCGYLGPTATA